MLKAYKYRLYPTKEQAEMFEQTFNATRLVYNLALELKKRAWEQRINLTKYDIGKQLPELKAEFTWLKEVNAQSLVAAIATLDFAYQQFFRGRGYPKFKSKREKQSFHCTGNKREVDWERNRLTIPKISDIPIVLHRKFEGKIKTITISRTATGKYFASIMVDTDQPLPEKKEVDESTAIGIDMGIRHFAILSDGTKYENPRLLQKSLDRLSVLQRRASKKKKGSNNQKKANKKVALLHEKIANQRKDFLHKLSDSIVKNYDTVCLETLGINKMMQELNMGLQIGDAGWGTFIKQLEYKAKWAGKNVIKIPRYIPSSKICSTCCIINNELQPMQVKTWNCPTCGTVQDTDINAAINILEIVLEYSGKDIPVVPVEQLAIVSAMKQEYHIDSVTVQVGSFPEREKKQGARLKMKANTHHLVKAKGKSDRKGRVSVDSG